MNLFQIISVLFALWMVYELTIHGKKKIISPAEVGVWLAVWVMFIVVALFPDLLIGIADTLRFTRVFDLLTVAGLMVLTVLVFLNYFAQRSANQKWEKLVQQLAIREVMEKSSPRKSRAK